MSELERMDLSFKNCQKQNMSLELYIEGYNHLYNVLLELGTVFGMIATDAREKVDILTKFARRNNPKYQTLRSMMLYERKLNIATGAELLGARTLLRLHRALKFVMLFVEKISDSSNHESVSTIAYQSYTDSLGSYHSWFLRHTAKLAVYALPSKRELLRKLYPGSKIDVSQNKLKPVCETLKHLYFSLDRLFTKYNLQDLP